MKNLSQHINESFDDSTVNEGFTQAKTVSQHPHPSNDELKKYKDYKLLSELSEVVTNLCAYYSGEDDLILAFDEESKFRKELTFELLDGKGLIAVDNTSGKVVAGPTKDLAKFFLNVGLAM